jgi:hypothetical protein
MKNIRKSVPNPATLGELLGIPTERLKPLSSTMAKTMASVMGKDIMEGMRALDQTCDSPEELMLGMFILGKAVGRGEMMKDTGAARNFRVANPNANNLEEFIGITGYTHQLLVNKIVQAMKENEPMTPVQLIKKLDKVCDNPEELLVAIFTIAFNSETLMVLDSPLPNTKSNQDVKYKNS